MPERHMPATVRLGHQHHYWWNSLSFRLGLTVNLIAVLVVIAFGGLDYRRERQVHLAEQINRLREEAKVLHVAQEQLNSAAEFQRYVDAYCQQMERHTSPGHHILVHGAEGSVIARAHERDDLALESKMSVQAEGSRTFQHRRQEYLVVSVKGRGDTTILVAQSLAPVKRIIRRQAVSRALSLAVLVALTSTITSYLLLKWVRSPIRTLVRGIEAVGARRFDTRITEAGTAEMRFLARGFNLMSESLAQTERRREHELAKARRIHLGLLPAQPTAVPGMSVAANYIPAAAVGGDYYDIMAYPDRTWFFTIADVSGHGVPPALVTAMLKALIRQAVQRQAEPAEIARMLNSEIGTLVGTEHFVTCLLARYYPNTGELEYVSCGHEPAILLGGGGRSGRRLESTGPPLGVDEQACWELCSVRLEVGGCLYLFTDGLVEVTNRQSQALGRNRLAKLILATARSEPIQQLNAVLRAVNAFGGSDSFVDDRTLVILRRECWPDRTD